MNLGGAYAAPSPNDNVAAEPAAARRGPGGATHHHGGRTVPAALVAMPPWLWIAACVAVVVCWLLVTSGPAANSQLQDPSPLTWSPFAGERPGCILTLDSRYSPDGVQAVEAAVAQLMRNLGIEEKGDGGGPGGGWLVKRGRKLRAVEGVVVQLVRHLGMWGKGGGKGGGGVRGEWVREGEREGEGPGEGWTKGGKSARGTREGGMKEGGWRKGGGRGGGDGIGDEGGGLLVDEVGQDDDAAGLQKGQGSESEGEGGESDTLERGRGLFSRGDEVAEVWRRFYESLPKMLDGHGKEHINKFPIWLALAVNIPFFPSHSGCMHDVMSATY
ncbi:unnamed protein product [Closterium sp. Naga37s-1]|nr:unnamed protein product [Closterium sp. Naga37s-1]